MIQSDIPIIKDFTASDFPQAGATDSPSGGATRGEEPAEYPDAHSFVAARHFLRWSHTEDRQVDKIVIHITAGQDSYERTVRFFQQPTRHGEPIKVSAHYVIGQGGEVVQQVRHNDIAYHACSANKSSIGIEHCARPPRTFGSSDPGLPPTAAQYRSSARLVRYLCALYGLPLSRAHVLGHVEADPSTSHTSCPDGAWDWDEYMTYLRSEE